MKIKIVKINNFGLYQGENIFDFALQVDPVVVVKGKNGVGKTTLAEAINLAIFGSLSLGERVSDNQYKQYLISRSHKSSVLSLGPTFIEIHFDYYKSGKAIEYVVRRSWNDIGVEKLDISENGKPITDLDEKEKSFYLKDIIPVGYNRIMFFDGEKLMNLSNTVFINDFIKESCESLLGLNLVYTLQRDLDTYIKRLIGDKNNSKLRSELEAAQQELDAKKQLKIELVSKLALSTEKAKGIHSDLESFQAKVNEKGRMVTDNIRSLDSRIKIIESEITETKHMLVELFNGIGPFSIVQNLIVVLKQKLLKETGFLKEKAAHEILKSKLATLELNWQSLTGKLSPVDNKHLLEQIKFILTGENSHIENFTPTHDLSETDRNNLIQFCEDAVIARGQIKELTVLLDKKENELKHFSDQKNTFSEESEVKPLIDKMQELTYLLGATDNEINSIIKKSQELDSSIDFYQQKINSIYKKLQELETSEIKLKMATNTNLALEAYSKKLLSSKLIRLASDTLTKFNLLSRKNEVADHLEIDSKTFNITLYKEGKTLDHQHLSAGEKQVLLLAILWAFHAITNVSIPLIIDTPLARLDIEHRHKILNILLPNISNQVIVIGTELELSDLADHAICNSIYKLFQLEYNEEEKRTSIKEMDRLLYNQEEIAC